MEYSFDVVSKVSMHEVTNAIDQARKEIATRYDLKDSGSEITQEADTLQLNAPNEFTLKSVIDILLKRLSSRGVPVKNLKFGSIERALGDRVKQSVTVQQGIPQEAAKTIVRHIKDTKCKVQASIQGDLVRVSSKSKDELQLVIVALKKSPVELDLQCVNYR